jgi:hypothetical protein
LTNLNKTFAHSLSPRLDAHQHGLLLSHPAWKIDSKNRVWRASDIGATGESSQTLDVSCGSHQ